MTYWAETNIIVDHRLSDDMIHRRTDQNIWGRGGQGNYFSITYPTHEFKFPVFSLISAKITRILV